MGSFNRTWSSPVELDQQVSEPPLSLHHAARTADAHHYAQLSQDSWRISTQVLVPELQAVYSLSYLPILHCTILISSLQSHCFCLTFPFIVCDLVPPTGSQHPTVPTLSATAETPVQQTAVTLWARRLPTASVKSLYRIPCPQQHIPWISFFALLIFRVLFSSLIPRITFSLTVLCLPSLLVSQSFLSIPSQVCLLGQCVYFHHINYDL